eukprot:gene13048-27533_t
MSVLGALKLVATKRPSQMTAVQVRRNKICRRLHEQIMLARAQKDGKKFAATKFRTTTDAETGERKSVEVTKFIKPWWFTIENGKTAIAVRYGARVLELAKGKFAVEIASNSDIVSTLEIIKNAVESGELDAQLEAAAGNLRSGEVIAVNLGKRQQQRKRLLPSTPIPDQLKRELVIRNLTKQLTQKSNLPDPTQQDVNAAIERYKMMQKRVDLEFADKVKLLQQRQHTN